MYFIRLSEQTQSKCFLATLQDLVSAQDNKSSDFINRYPVFQHVNHQNSSCDEMNTT